MTGTSALGLAPGDSAPVVAYATSQVTRGELRERAEALARMIEANKVERVLVSSDDPLHIQRAIEACSRAGADLFIAHTNLPAHHVSDVIREFGVRLRIGDSDESTGETGAGPAPAGRIYMMTSGTTGAPKIASHSLDSLLSRARASTRSARAGGKWLLTYQPTGFAGLQVILTAALGAGVIVVPEARSPKGFYDAARRHAVSQISATPTFWRAFLMVATPGELALRQITMGGEAADQATLDRVRQAFPDARVTHIYASTEAGVVFSVHDGREGFPAEWLESGIQGVRLRLRDGMLQILTPNAMRGYVNQAAQPGLEDGWLATADRVEIRGDRAYIMGREDSTINVAGSKVYPLMVEQFLLRQPGVREALVYGVPNPISGFLVAADVVLEPGPDPAAARVAILAACREGLAQYQVPRILKVVDAIVARESGKKG